VTGVYAVNRLLMVLPAKAIRTDWARSQETSQLVNALRQCDGRNLQCIVMIRDDFWMPVTRFLADLEVKLVQHENFLAADLFDHRHACKVLKVFGQAFGSLPENASDSTRQNESFLEDAVTGLAQDGQVICVRLALFAEMMKGKPWTPATLNQVGGTQGIGVTFLDETFSSHSASPEHRRHEKAARSVLTPVFVAAELGDFSEGVFVFMGLNPNRGETRGEVFAKDGCK